MPRDRIFAFFAPPCPLARLALSRKRAIMPGRMRLRVAFIYMRHAAPERRLQP
jgi:hypothetical protein